jgi:NADH:ubiquinone oxidoreductase subunit 6 (subunit J)
MTLVTVIFYIFLFLAAGAALGILLSKNVMKAALLLLLCLLGIAGLYVFAFAEFVAITQILIYAGGVLVVIVFGIMLTSRISEKHLQVDHTNIFSGVLVSLLMFGFLCTSIWSEEWTSSPSSSPVKSSMQIIGIQLITRFALPFEVSGILLLITLLGAGVMASFTKSKKI